MAFDPNRWTIKTQEAVQAALDERPPGQQPRGHPRPPARRAGRPARGCRPARAAEARRRPRGPAQPARREPQPPAARLRLRRPPQPRPDARSWTTPTRPARTSPTTTCPPSTCCWPWPTGSAWAGRTCSAPSQQVRGSHRVTSQNPESQYQALEKYGRDLTEEARQRPASTRSSAATTRSAGSCRCSPGARRTTRCSSVSPASARPPSSRASPGASSRATCPRRLRNKRLIALDLSLMVAGRQVPGRVRGAAAGRAEGDQGLRRRGRHVHRRDAHGRGRRRRRRGRHGRRQHAQAHAGPGRAAHDRRHHARRVPQVRREGRRPRAPLPAGLRGRALRRGHDRHPAGPQGALRGPPRRAHPGHGAGLARPCSPTAT